jgi:hypothetical protein
MFFFRCFYSGLECTGGLGLGDISDNKIASVHSVAGRKFT